MIWIITTIILWGYNCWFKRISKRGNHQNKTEM